MIKLLSIKNLLLIDQVDLSFEHGLCVLTGETGAGKSMILDSLNLITGERAKSSFKPNNGKPMSVSALIDITNFTKVKETLKELEINCEDEILVKRVINTDGKNRCFINENIVTTTILKSIFSNIIEIHSQFSEQGLLDTNTHINILDDAGNYQNKIIKLNKLWENLQIAKVDYEELINKSEVQKKIQEDIKFDLNEIKTLNPIDGEFSDLKNKKLIFQNSAKISETLGFVMNNYQAEEPPGIEVLCSRTIKSLDEIKDLLDDGARENIKNLSSLFIEIQESFKNIEDLTNYDFNISNLNEVDERIELYKKIAKKHQVSENELSNLINLLSKKLDKSLNFDQELNLKKANFKSLEKQYYDLSTEISDLRKINASNMDIDINSELPALKLENAKFKTFIEQATPNVNGTDKVTFKIRTNPLSEMGLIKNISSGGELCRIALAIKVIAQKKNKTTMVFDEVDSGIGGAVSSAVGERLKKLGISRQVIVVTHSPQVAAYGNDHFIVTKISKNQQVEIDVKKIDLHEKINEVARMLSGKNITEEAINAAKRLLEN